MKALGAPKRKSAPGRAAAKQAEAAAPPFDLSNMLAQANWKDADEALAKALRDFTALEQTSQALGRKLSGGPIAAHAQEVEAALWAVSQSLRNAGRKRNLQRFGAVGAVEDFDERLHVLIKPVKQKPGRVKVVAQGVVRGIGPSAEIVLKALAAPVRRATATAARKTV